MKVKIAINGRFLTQSVTGVQRVARETIRSLAPMLNAAGFEVVIFCPPQASVEGSFEGIPVRKVGRLSGHLWEQLELPWYVFGWRLINFCNTGPILCKSLISYMHDAQVYLTPESYSSTFVFFYKMIQPALARRSSCVVTVSDASKATLVKNGVCREDKLAVVYNGVDHFLSVVARQGFADEITGKCPFILLLGSDKTHKNINTIVEAFISLELPGVKLVVTNAVGLNLPDSESLIALGKVSDPELKDLYCSANLFVFPSLTEGFGLPPLEALSCQCPVLLSDIEVFRELFGEAVNYVRATDVAAWREAISRKLTVADESTGGVWEKYRWNNSAIKLFGVIQEGVK